MLKPMLKPIHAFLLICSTTVFAAQSGQATPNLVIANKTESVSVTPKVIASAPTLAAQNLDGIDKTSRDILEINRQIELAKKKNDLRQQEAGGNQSNSGTGGPALNSNSQTTVLGVSINGVGKRFATLQFADGGTLDVEVGSKVGKYIVKEIEINKVVLGSSSKKSKGSIVLNRFYENSSKPRNPQSPTSAFSSFTPSPVTTDANMPGTQMVPPIVSVR